MKHARNWLTIIKHKNPSLSEEDDELLLGAYEEGYRRCFYDIIEAYNESDGDFEFAKYDVGNKITPPLTRIKHEN